MRDSRLVSLDVRRKYQHRRQTRITTGKAGMATQKFSRETKITAMQVNSTFLSTSRRSRGSLSSMLSTSIEKRFRIRPVGLVSKNRTGALKTAKSMLKTK